jgi:hypothetical protein
MAAQTAVGLTEFESQHAYIIVEAGGPYICVYNWISLQADGTMVLRYPARAKYAGMLERKEVLTAKCKTMVIPENTVYGRYLTLESAKRALKRLEQSKDIDAQSTEDDINPPRMRARTPVAPNTPETDTEEDKSRPVVVEPGRGQTVLTSAVAYENPTKKLCRDREVVEIVSIVDDDAVSTKRVSCSPIIL